MKKQLLFILSVMLFTATSQAQIKVWNFAGDNLPGYDNLLDTNTKMEFLYSGTGGNIGASGSFDSSNEIGSFGATTDKVFYVNDGGGDRLRMNTAGFTAYNDETKSTFKAFFGEDVPWGRLYSNGTGSDSRRYYGFNLKAGDVITIYFYIDNNLNNTVKIDFPTAENNLTEQIDNTESKDGHMYQIKATEDGLYKFYTIGTGNPDDGSAKICVGRIYEGSVVLENGNVLGIKDIKSTVSTEVKAIGNRIYVSNVKSETEVNIFSVTGALIKTINTSEDLDFEFNTGLWFATVKSAEGQKSAKLLVK